MLKACRQVEVCCPGDNLDSSFKIFPILDFKGGGTCDYVNCIYHKYLSVYCECLDIVVQLWPIAIAAVRQNVVFLFLVYCISLLGNCISLFSQLYFTF